MAAQPSPNEGFGASAPGLSRALLGMCAVRVNEPDGVVVHGGGELVAVRAHEAALHAGRGA
eukprot:13318971-Alexandrium_andersonii.AAC.1